jgi:multidrug efflux system membrane fusion protein
VPVVTARAVTRAMPVTLKAVGSAEALSTVDVRSQVTGQLSAIHFREGQDVAKGAPLFTLDARPFQAALSQAEAVLARDTAQASNARTQLERAKNLFDRGLISRDQYDTQNASASALEAPLAADRAQVETARLNLQYTRITAPISGRTGALQVHVGDLIRANDTTPMVVINQVNPIYVTFSLPGRLLSDIRQQQAKGALKLEAMQSGAPQTSAADGTAPAAPATAPQPGAASDTPPVETGTLTFIDNSIDPTTGTIKLKGTFTNANHALWPGLFTQVTLLLRTEPNALVVPAAAVQESQQGQFVYVVTPDHTAEVRPVKVERQDGEVAVIAQGINPGDEVVTDGQLRLTPGARVSTRPPDARPRPTS